MNQKRLIITIEGNCGEADMPDGGMTGPETVDALARAVAVAVKTAEHIASTAGGKHAIGQAVIDRAGEFLNGDDAIEVTGGSTKIRTKD